jgi:hypothetical protein
MTTTQNTETVHLQSIGRVRAIPASELAAGDVMVWNFGHTSTVVAVTPKGAQSLTVVERSSAAGAAHDFERVVRKTRLIVVTSETYRAHQARKGNA